MKRTLIATDAFSSQAEELQNSMQRADEFLEGARWLLERDAEAGVRVQDEPPIHALTMEMVPGHPKLTLSYSIDYDQILLLSVG